MLADEDASVVVLSNNRVCESPHVLDTDVRFRRELDPNRTNVGWLAGGRSVLFQHFLGGVCLEGQIFAPIVGRVSTFGGNNYQERGAGVLRTAFGVAKMVPEVIKRNVDFFFGDLVALRETLTE